MKYLLVGLLLLICCNRESFVTEEEKFFTGTHDLLALIAARDSTSGRYISAPDIEVYFICKNNIGTFLWKNNKGEFISATLPYDKCRFVFFPEDSTATPYVKFRWGVTRSFLEAKWQEYVIYYVIGVKRSQTRNQ